MMFNNITTCKLLGAILNLAGVHSMHAKVPRDEKLNVRHMTNFDCRYYRKLFSDTFTINYEIGQVYLAQNSDQ
jgi:hypothetical protein